MRGYPSKAEIETIRNKYPKGTFVIMRHMRDDWQPIDSGTAGVVQCVDDVGTVHVFWETGRRLGFIEGLDEVEIIDIEEK